MIIQNGGSYLKADLALKGKIITFVDEGIIETSNKYRYVDKDGKEGDFRKSLVFTVKLNGEEKRLRLNKASQVACFTAWGNDSKFWIGKSAMIHILPFGDGTQKMIVLDPVVESKDVKKDVEDINWKD